MSSERESKRLRVSNDNKIIGTHNGTFHCDEALAVFLLRQLETYAFANLVRTRDQSVLDDCTIVVDVGAVYDEERLRFDHHQKGFQEVFGHGFTTKLSSAGLIYKHFGKDIIQKRLKTSSDDPRIHVLYLKLYKEFIEGIDAIDNGVSQYATELQPNYKIRTDLSARVGWLNPAWNEACDNEDVDARFNEASKLTGNEFYNRLDYYISAWLPAREIVVSAVTRRTEVDEQGRIVVLEQFAPWKEHLFDIEQELKLTSEVLPLYVLYPDETGGNWRVQAVPTSSESFTSRKPLPEPWRGLRDEPLDQVTGVSRCVFVHSTGFIGGNKTREGALEMAQRAIVH